MSGCTVRRSSVSLAGLEMSAVVNEANHFPVTGLVPPQAGEALIREVRDPSGDDPGEPDKRFCAVFPEFAEMLSKMGIENSSLGQLARKVWDGKPIQNSTRSKRIRSGRRTDRPRAAVSPGHALWDRPLVRAARRELAPDRARRVTRPRRSAR